MKLNFWLLIGFVSAWGVVGCGKEKSPTVHRSYLGYRKAPVGEPVMPEGLRRKPAPGPAQRPRR